MELWIADSCLSKEASWEEALAGLRQILPATPVSLVRTDSTALKAQGAKAKLTLHLCKLDDHNHLIIGRHRNEARRGHMTISDNFISLLPGNCGRWLRQRMFSECFTLEKNLCQSIR